jgi:hypothetical protein
MTVSGENASPPPAQSNLSALRSATELLEGVTAQALSDRS